MASLPSLARHRALPISHLRSSIHHISPTVLVLCQASTAPQCTSRHFWWGRCGHRHKSASVSAAYQKCLEVRARIAKQKTEKGSLSSAPLGCPAHYSRCHGWRLASSHGKVGKDTEEGPNDKSKEEKARDDDWASESEKLQNEINAHLERIRKRMETYPYETLFGRSIKNGVWNPWGTDWDKVMRKLDWNVLAGGKGSKSKNEPSGGSQWTGMTPESKNPHNHATDSIGRSSSSSDGEIDLITLRRVHKDASNIPSTAMEANDDTGFDIPVKTFNPSDAAKMNPSNTKKSPSSCVDSASKGTLGPKSSIDNSTSWQSTLTDANAVQYPQTWLNREGFSEKSKPEERTPNAVKLADRHDTAELPTRLESSLDRHIRKDDTMTAQSTPEGTEQLESSLDRHLRTTAPFNPELVHKPPLGPEYNVKENRADDVDLLRASDIRASSGQFKRRSLEYPSAKNERRRNLESNFDKRNHELDARYAAEVDSTSTERRSTSSAHKKTLSVNDAEIMVQAKKALDTDGLNMNSITSEEPSPTNVDAWGYDLTPQGLETSYHDEVNSQVVRDVEERGMRHQREMNDAVEAKNTQKRNAAAAALAEEINSQTAAMSAFETKPHGLEKDCADNSGTYLGERKISLNRSKTPDAIQRDAQRAKDQALVHEIREIYEGKYGPITQEHRQPFYDHTMEGRLDPAVQEGLREYDEKMASESKIAATDLSKEEIALLTEFSVPFPQLSVPSIAPIDNLKKSEAREPPKLGLKSTDSVPLVQENNIIQVPDFEAIDNMNSKQVQELSGKYRVMVKEVLATLEETLGVVKKVLARDESGSDSTSTPVPVTSDDKTTEPIKPSPSMYTILAYDESTDRVRTATSTSSIDGLTPSSRSPGSILAYLENPIKYFEYLEALEASGYELVAGSRKSLVLKKVREKDQLDLKSMQATINSFLEKQSSEPSAVKQDNSEGFESNYKLPAAHKTTTQSSVDLPITSLPAEALDSGVQRHETTTPEYKSSTSPNPIDGTTSPTPPHPYTPLSPTPSQASQPIRREEEVFSGLPRLLTRDQYKERRRQQRLSAQILRDRAWREESRQRRKIIWRNTKRMFWTGLWVAGCLYAVGALLEEVYRPRRESEGERKEL